MEERLSEWLTSQIDLFDTREGNTRRADESVARNILQRIAEEQVEGRVAFIDGSLERLLRKFTGEYSEPLEQMLRNEPEIGEAEIDRVLTTRALEGMREAVERVLHLQKLDLVRIPSNQTAKYVREAARSYIYGLFQCSAAMSRIGLEQALKEALGRQGTEDFVKFRELRKEAEQKGILDRVTGPAASKVAKDANDVIHHRLTDANGALDILTNSRGLIVRIYAAASC